MSDLRKKPSDELNDIIGDNIYHDNLAKRKPIAVVINNNQPGWTNIIETEPHVTLGIGTKLYTRENIEALIKSEQNSLLDRLITKKFKIGIDNGQNEFAPAKSLEAIPLTALIAEKEKLK